MLSNIRIAAVAYELPETIVSVNEILLDEKERVSQSLEYFPEEQRQALLDSIGIHYVRVCKNIEPYELGYRATQKACDEAGIDPRDISLIIDFSTFPGREPGFFSIGNQLSKDLNIDSSLNICFKIGGCAGLHLALKLASSIMQTDPSLNTALLVAADSPPPGNRSLLPISIQSDSGIALVLDRDSNSPQIIDSEIITLGFLHDVITIESSQSDSRGLSLKVDAEKIDRDLKPIYYLNFHRLIYKILEKANISISEIDHFIYANLNKTDQDGFITAFNVPPEKNFQG